MNLNKKRIIGISLFFTLVGIINIFPLIMTSINDEDSFSEDFEEIIDNEIDNPKSSAIYPEITTITIDPLSANPNEHWSWYANNKGWCSGSGSIATPYIIDSLSVDVSGSGDCLLIKNTNGIYFEIRNSFFKNCQSGTYAGIQLQNSDGGIIYNCNISANNQYGVFLTGGSDNTQISNCIINDNQNDGIKIDCGSKGSKILNSDIMRNSDGIGFSTIDNIIYNNNIINNTDDGIYMTLGSGNTIINNNRILSNDDTSHAYGIFTYGDNQITSNTINTNYEGISGGASDNLYIYDNTIQSNEQRGIDFSFEPSDNISIIANTIMSNAKEGIFLEECYNTTISLNTISNNGYEGIWLDDCGDSKIINNQINDNGDGTADDQYGIGIDDTSNLLISENTLLRNDNYGIYVIDSGLTSTLRNVNVIGNTIEDSDFGVHMDYLSDSMVYGNNIVNNTNVGISVENGLQNTISYNTVSDSVISIHSGDTTFGTYCSVITFNTLNLGTIGINVYDDWDIITNNKISNFIIGINTNDNCDDNQYLNNEFESNMVGLFFDDITSHNFASYNSFIDNDYHIFDDGVANLIKFNYYDNYNGTDTNGDGIGELQYNLSGDADNIDYFPLTSNPNIPETSNGDDDDDNGTGDDDADADDETSPASIDWIIWILVIGLVGGGVAVVGYLYQQNKTRKIIIPRT
jgi:parallel beta-helix repeat protein